MGLLKKITDRVLGTKTESDKNKQSKTDLLRRCYFEVMEERRVLSADPVIAGVTYLEGDSGQDTTPDHFEVSFEGGAETTQLTQFVINGDQDQSGTLTDGDMFFDVDSNQPGTADFHAFQFDAANSSGITADDIVSYNVSDDGLALTVELRNFEAGDKFAFTIDVDEVERFRTDKIASGVEFEGSLFNATFEDDNYVFVDKTVAVNAQLEDGPIQPQSEGIFYDEYNELISAGEGLVATNIDLNEDNNLGQKNRTAAAIDAYDLQEKPITISGSVYHDEDADCYHDSDEGGIANVDITLQLLNESTGNYENVATTQTDINGDYEFGLEYDLKPGTYRLVETQPDGFLSVGANAGTVDGVSVGSVDLNGQSEPNILSEITVALGGTAATDYDFCEVKPASISGKVWHDENDDGIINNGEEGIANVLIQITRVGAKDGVTSDPFADTAPIFIRTDADGCYEVDSLPPGVYEVVEINNYPPGEVDPLAGFIDGKDSVGNVGGTTVGVGENDKVNQVVLCAGDDGVEYNFGELKPAEISGYVSLTTPGGDCLDPSDPNHIGIEGVAIELYDIDGNLVASTLTDDTGHYEFDDLKPGTYTIVEIQPSSYIDAGQSIGMVDGQSLGSAADDKFTAVTLGSGSEGVMYNFCETIPAELCGTVWHDANDNGIMESDEERIGGVVIQLFDADGNMIAETRTDAEGKYCFKELYPGEYCVKEIQPTGFTDGQDSLGSVARGTAIGQVGTMTNDKFANITLEGGDRGIEYNFGELRSASISGMVHQDADGNCIFDATEGDRPLVGAEIILLDASGAEVARTVTDDQGMYSFDDLRPGTYSVREITPDGFLNGGTKVGQVGGIQAGVLGNDLISGITLTSGQAGVNYDFCEHVPAELKGTVWHDANDDGIIQVDEERISGVVIQLFDVDGNMVAETITDAEGNYCFENLFPGEYCVKEIQPTDFIDGKDSLGDVGQQDYIVPQVGTVENDKFSNINLKGGDRGVNYNFGELKLGAISGTVHVDNNGNCILEAENGERPLAGVTIELLNSDLEVIATTTTDANGNYSFDNLLPGTYSIRETQPEGFFTGGEKVGDGGGAAAENFLTDIVVGSGQKLTQYDFCETEAAEIHGRVWEDGPGLTLEETAPVPENYREQFDGIYDPSVDTALAGVRMQLYYYIDPALGDIAPRAVTLGEVDASHYSHMGTSDPDAPVWVDTMDNGEYWFLGLQAGNYIVLETQPDGYLDSNDTVGTTTGFTFNSLGQTATAPEAVLRQFSGEQVMDSVVNIRVNAGGISEANNFSEVSVERFTTPVLPPPPPFQPPGTPRVPNPEPPSPGVTGYPGLMGSEPSAFTQFIGNSRGASFQTQAAVASDPYTWHLSVINGGIPRGEDEGMGSDSVWQQAGYISDGDWNRFDMDNAVWSFTETRGDDNVISETGNKLRFGVLGGTPLAGDFDGDGIDELAVFKAGYWMLDLNHNGRWDETDLLAKLGDADDRPVVGDWDGDGKDDIGIFGPIWEHDPEAIERDPGLPNPENSPFTKPKNVPPVDEDAARGARVMKLTSYGRQRADVVDHVFGVDDGEVTPVTGDWNGNGIRSIGKFVDGHWHLDVNGDGQFDYEDITANFGQAGDVPVVGDFDGDGVEEIAVYRAGTWLIDTNGNRELDATDKTFDMGTAADKPVVGDWDGDGLDEPGLYTEQQDPIF